MTSHTAHMPIICIDSSVDFPYIQLTFTHRFDLDLKRKRNVNKPALKLPKAHEAVRMLLLDYRKLDGVSFQSSNRIRFFLNQFCSFVVNQYSQRGEFILFY